MQPPKSPAPGAPPGTPPPSALAPPYRIILRSRKAVVTPENSREGQTGGGFIQVTQLEANVVMFHMRGAAAAGIHCKGSAAMQFELTQDFEIVPTRERVLPPRLSLTNWLIGTLLSTDHGGGTAEQAAACSSVESAGHTVLNLCAQPHSVTNCQKLFVNDREGPLEVPVVPCLFTLRQTFALRVNQPPTLHHAAAVADFDPEARLDVRWEDVLKPFRAVPHRDFGFRAILHVVEDTPPPGALAGSATLPPPTPADKRKMPFPDPNDKE